MTDRYDIRVELNPKPIPDRRHDWDCWLVDDPEFGTESAATPWKALRDMADRLEMEDDARRLPPGDDGLGIWRHNT